MDLSIKPNQIEALAPIILRYLPLKWSVALGRYTSNDLRLIERSLAKIASNANEREKQGTQVLFWRGVPGRASIHGEAIVSLALRLRGIKVNFVICDGSFNGCIMRSVEQNDDIRRWKKRCPECIVYGLRILEALGIPYIKMSKLVSKQCRNKFRDLCESIPNSELYSYRYDQIQVGQFALSSTQRYLKGLPTNNSEKVFREYLYSALICAEAAKNSILDLRPERIFMQRHIEYVEWGPAYLTFTRAGLPSTLWAGNVAIDGQISLRNVFEVDMSSLYNLSDEAWEHRRAKPLTEQEENAIDSIIKKTWRGRTPETVRSQEKFALDAPHTKKELLLRDLGISRDRPIWCVFSHVTWDSGFNPEVMVFRDVIDWILSTVRAMLETKGITWLIKIHPGESLGTRIGIEQLLKNKFPAAGKKILFIPADSEITANDLCSILSGGITMHGTIGVQLPAHGIPVIVGESTHYTGKNFTHDGFTRELYLDLVHHVADIPSLSDHQRNLARRYAYSLYFQRRIPLNAAKKRTGYTQLDPEKIDLLLPGNDAAMEMICNRIMNGGEFILDNSRAIPQE
jgi:hypothetical protein